MIQTTIVIILVILSAAYIAVRLRNTAKGCTPEKCSGCSLYDDCGDENKKSRP